MKTLADIGEQKFLQLLKRRINRVYPGIIKSIGDDAALLKQLTPQAVFSSDMLVEKVDFDFSWASYADVGHKAAAVNLSDLAAMGAKPRALLASIACKPTTKSRDALTLLTTLHKIGLRYGAPLVGGDVSSTQGPLVISVTAIGETSQPLQRHQGEIGDALLVSGSLGKAALGLQFLQQHQKTKWNRFQLRPTPQIALGLKLSRLVKSTADISDGLLKDVQSVLKKGCKAVLWAEKIPKPKEASLEHALSGGEDFELICAASKQKLPQLLALGFAVVGEIQKGQGVEVCNFLGQKLQLKTAFEHFKKT